MKPTFKEDINETIEQTTQIRAVYSDQKVEAIRAICLYLESSTQSFKLENDSLHNENRALKLEIEALTEENLRLKHNIGVYDGLSQLISCQRKELIESGVYGVGHV
jgi:hypothetical protein